MERSWKRLRNSPNGTEFLEYQSSSKNTLSDKIIVGVAEDLTQTIDNFQSTAVVLDVQLSCDQREKYNDIIRGDGAESNQDGIDLRFS